MFWAQKGKSLKWQSSTSAEHISWRPWIAKHALSCRRRTSCQRTEMQWGLLVRSVYRFRTASANWQRDWKATLEQVGYKVGVANPALFYSAEEGCRGGVHGDDCAVVGSRRALDPMGKTLSGKYSVRESHRLGFGNHCERHAQLLNRVVSVGADSDGRRYVRIEPDSRHSELVPRNLGMEFSKTKPLTTPRFKLDEKEHALTETEASLEAADATRYTSCIMRLSFLAQDRAHLGEPVKCSARSKSKPKPGSLKDLKKVARYLLGTKHMALHLWRRTFPSSISTYVDGDFAGCRLTRKSTTGMVQMIGEHAVKHTSNLQSATGLHVSECEYYALTHGGGHGLGLKAHMTDLGFQMSLQIFSDSSAGKSFRIPPRIRTSGSRRVAAAYVSLQKVKGAQNAADIFNKAASREILERHRKMMGLRQVEPLSSQKELRLESLDRKLSVLACERTQQSTVSADQSQLCDTCDKPADTSRTSTDEIMGLWLCRYWTGALERAWSERW